MTKLTAEHYNEMNVRQPNVFVAKTGTIEGLLEAFRFYASPQGHDFWAEYAFQGKPIDEAYHAALQAIIDFKPTQEQ